MRCVLALVAAACSAAPSPTVTASPAPARAKPQEPRRLVGDPASRDRIVAAQLVAAIDDAAASDRPAYARADQRVTLYAVLVAEHAIYSDAPTLRLAGKRVTARPLAQAPACELRWSKIEPAVASMTNGDTPGEFHFAAIDYRATPLASATNAGAIAADVHPTLTPDHGDGVGTMRFQLVVQQGDTTIASPGPEARRGKGSGGLTDAVLRVSIRRDDSYLGYLTEMFGQPYIWASAGLSDDKHESERLEGSDCADFVVYGARRMGKRIKYTWTGGLPQITTLLGAGTRGSDGVYRDRDGKALPFTKVGDLVLFPRHVGVLSVDRGQRGVLDDQDLMMHTLFDTPKEQPIADSGYADKPVELRRL